MRYSKTIYKIGQHLEVFTFIELAHQQLIRIQLIGHTILNFLLMT